MSYFGHCENTSRRSCTRARVLTCVNMCETVTVKTYITKLTIWHTFCSQRLDELEEPIPTAPLSMTFARGADNLRI